MPLALQAGTGAGIGLLGYFFNELGLLGGAGNAAAGDEGADAVSELLATLGVGDDAAPARPGSAMHTLAAIRRSMDGLGGEEDGEAAPLGAAERLAARAAAQTYESDFDRVTQMLAAAVNGEEDDGAVTSDGEDDGEGGGEGVGVGEQLLMQALQIESFLPWRGSSSQQRSDEVEPPSMSSMVVGADGGATAATGGEAGAGDGDGRDVGADPSHAGDVDDAADPEAAMAARAHCAWWTPGNPPLSNLACEPGGAFGRRSTTSLLMAALHRAKLCSARGSSSLTECVLSHEVGLGVPGVFFSSPACKPGQLFVLLAPTVHATANASTPRRVAVQPRTRAAASEGRALREWEDALEVSFVGGLDGDVLLHERQTIDGVGSRCLQLLLESVDETCRLSLDERLTAPVPSAAAPSA